METFFNSFFLVFAGEMGDKTQLLALLLVARFKRPWMILCGVLIATLLNHALAAWLGSSIAALIHPVYLKWGLAVIFFAFAVWILVPDNEGEVGSNSGYGVLLTTIIAFFLAEMGDKTQLATVALSARYASMVTVTLGTTAGMLGANGLAIFFGERLLRKIPMKWVRGFACTLFLAFGLGILFMG